MFFFLVNSFFCLEFFGNRFRQIDDLQLLLEWINDVLADDRIIVKDIEEDLFDGQILQKLIGNQIILNMCD